MHATRRAALWAAAMVATVDVLMLRRAWASVGERAALWSGAFALACGTALLLTPWLRALTAGARREVATSDHDGASSARNVRDVGSSARDVALSDRDGASSARNVALSDRDGASSDHDVARAVGDVADAARNPSSPTTLGAPSALARARALAADRIARAAAAVVAGIPLGIALSSTHLAQARLGRAAPALLAATISAALWLLPSIARLHVGRAPLGRVLLAAAGAATLAFEALLPRRLYPSLRATLLAIGFVALACALGAAKPRLPADWRSWRRWRSSAVASFAGVLLLLAGRTLVDVSANTRFVANAQAPATALVLDAVTMVKPFVARSLSQPATALRPAATTAAAAKNGAPSAPGVTTGATAAAANGLTNLAPLNRADADLADIWAQAAAPLGDAHVVIVTVDALRADRLRPEHMPLVAAATAHSLAFSRAYATAPSTAASITALLTAHHPSHLDARPPTLAQIARAQGWLTAAFFPAGLFFDGGGPLLPYANDHFGFEWVDTRTLPAEELTDAVLTRVQQLVADGEPRSLLWVHYFDPHEPYELHGLPADAPPLARYDAEVAAVDGALARLINGLTNLARPTLLVITGDHGEEFGEHGGAYHGSSVYDEQLRVPLVVTVVGRALLPAVTIATPVSLVDVAPTLAALAGLPPSAGDGRPLPPLDPAPRDVVAAVHTRRMLLRWPWKLIHDLRRDVDELYDLQSDPREMRNAYDVHADVGGELRAALGQWLNQSPPSLLATRLGDPTQPAATRAQAARELGEREAFAAAAALQAALADRDPAVRAEAALALGQLSDARARAALRALVDDDAYGDRAALMLGRLRDDAAAPRLAAICRRPFAEGDSAAAALQREAAHYLGFVGGAGDVAALWSVAADPRVRGAAYVSVGRIAGRVGDRRAAGALLDRFAVEDHDDARVDLAWALGLAGDARAVDALAAAAAAEPPLPRASEALVRLGAVATTTWAPNSFRPPVHARPSPRPIMQASRVTDAPLPAAPPPSTVGGIDLVCRHGRVPAVEAALEQWLGASSCTLDAPTASLRAVAPAGADVILVRARALGDNAQLTVIVDGVALPPLTLGPRYQEARMVKPISEMVKPIRIELKREGSAIELDHVLLLRDVTPARL